MKLRLPKLRPEIVTDEPPVAGPFNLVPELAAGGSYVNIPALRVPSLPLTYIYAMTI